MLAVFNFIFWAKDGTAPRASTRAAMNTNQGTLRTIFPFIVSSFLVAGSGD
jgi:hypothetical protein